MIRTLDRTEAFDERSKDFQVPLTNTNLTIKKYECPITLDQGTEGMCVGAGLTHRLSTEKPHLGFGFAKMLYKLAQKNDVFPGEDYSGTSVLAGLRVLKKLDYIESYQWAFGIGALVNGLLTKGPAVLGLNWYEGMYNTDRKGFIEPTGKKTGGHCILCNGVNLDSEVFLLHNSWGKKWGFQGECLISFEDMAELIRQRADMTFVEGVK